MKTIKMQHELTEELEKRSGVVGLKLIRMEGYSPSWELGGIREKPINDETEAKLQKALTTMQVEFDMA
jgi:hypothetical protein